jgi:predicted HD phosphohydrolase
MSEQSRQTVQTLFGYLRAQGDSDYIGEAVSQLEHSLQAAALARESGSSNDVVIAALLHDVGRFLPQSTKLPRMLADDGTYIGTASHDSVGERYLKSVGFPESVCSIVGAHVWAKRYLCATETGYWESLSKSSKATLVHQVG